MLHRTLRRFRAHITFFSCSASCFVVRRHAFVRSMWHSAVWHYLTALHAPPLPWLPSPHEGHHCGCPPGRPSGRVCPAPWRGCGMHAAWLAACDTWTAGGLCLGSPGTLHARTSSHQNATRDEERSCSAPPHRLRCQTGLSSADTGSRSPFTSPPGVPPRQAPFRPGSLRGTCAQPWTSQCRPVYS